MALQTIGTLTADWNSKSPLVFPPFSGRRDRAYMLYANAAGVTQLLERQYLVVYAQFQKSIGTSKGPLRLKYFPDVVTQEFAIAVSNGDFNNQVPVQVVMLPREFKPGTATVKALDITLLYDDDDNRDVVYLGG